MNVEFSPEDENLVFQISQIITGLSANHKSPILLTKVKERMLKRAEFSLANYLEMALNEPAEYDQLLSALTIHTTGFFREKKHFEFIEKELSEGYEGQTIAILSAGASTGQEAYTCALVLEKLKRQHKIKDYVIEGWDIDPISLAVGRHGFYSSRHINSDEWLELGSAYAAFIEQNENEFSIRPELRAKVEFHAVNLLAIKRQPIHQFHFVLCRNILIYFTPTDCDRVIEALCGFLGPEGFFITGHSESASFKKQGFLRHLPSIFVATKNAQESLSTTSSCSGLYKEPKSISSVIKRLKVPHPDILLVDDESDILELLEGEFRSCGYDVIATNSGETALKLFKEYKPKIVFSDLHMHGISGLELARKMRSLDPRAKIVIMTGGLGGERMQELDHIGVVDTLLKPFEKGEIQGIMSNLLRSNFFEELDFAGHSIELIVIGASTGGPDALDQVLMGLSGLAHCPPIAIVQHISEMHSHTFFAGLAKKHGFDLELPLSPQSLKERTLYASDGKGHLRLAAYRHSQVKIQIVRDRLDQTYVPSVDELFSSVPVFLARKTLAILLTGMGRDGALGMKGLCEQGALTISQDQQSAKVFGMPREAIALGAAKFVGNPAEMNELLKLIIKALPSLALMFFFGAKYFGL